ncbi:DUF3329 domain-containing protein [Acetobacterium wieringae]|uniref:Glycosyltransferase RgtA/B/C/D-like domain-containing protein n=1 Tax=Acetobacterium wieringae TaxID=52694 RepID=A0A1F2PFP2_9FIRM|nr:DUF6056 family protein [Acetobacterium wieringae]OFV70113.1 hypothetical protein ACWI_23180 [Acetobacterium wieringae]TYC87349.1 hypothetical protein FXB42_04340 [Acetobacterium wieringae]
MMNSDRFGKKYGNRAIQNLIESRKTNLILFWVIVAVTFAYMVFLNSKTPLIADDFVYTFIFATSTPVMSFGDIVTSQISYYMTWGGRVVAETLTQLFMFLGKDVFNVANSLCYIVFCLAVYFLAMGRRIRFELVLLTTILVWFFIPMFGQTVMWLTGSCNYLWCGTIILLALLPFRLYEEKQTRLLNSIWFAVLMIPLFFTSGITNENTAGGMILIMLLYCGVNIKRKIRIPAFAYTGLLFSIAGFLCMLFAPGNSLRVANESAVAEVTMMVGSNPIITRLSYFAYNLYALMPLVILAAIAFVMLRNEKDRNAWVNFGIFTVAAAAAMFVMLAPPKFPPRAMFGLAAFLIIAVVYAFGQLEMTEERIRKFVIIPGLAVLLFYIMSWGYVGIDAITVNKQYVARVQIIEEHQNEALIQVPEIVPLSSHNGMYGLKDVQLDPNHWVNRALADYFGVPNIVRQP